MNLTLTALTAAVVTACFVSAGPVKNEPVFPMETITSSAQVQAYVNPVLKNSIRHNVYTNIGNFSYGYEDPVILTVEESVESTGHCEAAIRVYSFQYCRAYFKHEVTTPPYEVFGFYNNTVIFGSTKNINVRNIEVETLQSAAALDFFFVRGVPHTVEDLRTFNRNIQFYYKHMPVTTQHNVYTNVFVRDPSNISPYKTVSGIQFNLSSFATSVVPPTIDYFVPYRVQLLYTQGALAVVPYKLASNNITAVVSNGTAQTYAKHSNITSSVMVYTHLQQILLHCIQGIPNTVNNLSTEATVSAVAGANKTSSVSNTTSTASVVGMFRIQPVNVVAELETFAACAEFYKHEKPVVINHIQTSGQSDLRFGNTLMIARTENLYSTLGGFARVYNPGIKHVHNEVASDFYITPIAGANKTVDSSNDSEVDSTGVVNLQPYKLLEVVRNTTSTTLTAVNTYTKHSVLNNNQNVLQSSFGFSKDIGQAAFCFDQLSSMFGIQYVVKDAVATARLSTVGSTGFATEIYKAPVVLPDQIETVASSFEFACFAIQAYAGVNTLNSTLPNIQTRVKDASATVVDVFNTLHGADYFKTLVIQYVEATLNSSGHLSLVPYKLAGTLHNTLLSTPVISAYCKDILSTGLDNSLSTSFGDLRTAVGLRISISGYTEAMQSVGITSLSVGRTLETSNSLLSVFETLVGPIKDTTPSVVNTLSTQGYTNIYKGPAVGYNISNVVSAGVLSAFAKDDSVSITNTTVTNFFMDARGGKNTLPTLLNHGNTILNNIGIYRNPGLNVVLNSLSTAGQSSALFGLMRSYNQGLNTLSTVGVSNTTKENIVVNRLNTLITGHASLVYVKYNTASNLSNTLNTVGSATASAGANKTASRLETLSTILGASGVFRTPSVNYAENTLNTAWLLSSFVKHTQPICTNSVGTSGQSDLIYGNDTYVSRTESVTTSLGSLLTFRNPGLNVVLNTLLSTGNITVVAGANKTNTGLNTLSTVGYCNTVKQNIATNRLNTLSTTQSTLAYAKHTGPTGVVKTLNTSWGVQVVAGANKSATALNQTTSTGVGNTTKENRITRTETTITVGMSSGYAKHTTMTPLNTLSTSGFISPVFGPVKTSSGNSNTLVTGLGSAQVFRTPGVYGALNTLNTVGSYMFVGGHNRLPVVSNTLSTSGFSNVSKETVASPLNTLVTAWLTAVYAKHATASGTNTLTTSSGSQVYAKHTAPSGHLNTLTTVFGGVSVDVVAPVTITLNKGSGTGGTNSIVSVAGFHITPTSVTVPNRTHYIFNGYFTLTTGGTKYINADGSYNNLTHSTFTSNTTLYAQWTDVVYTITWKAFSGTTLKTDNLIYGSTSNAPTGTTDTAQYDYAWPKTSTTVTGNETITETRTLLSYTITWKAYSGATLKSETLTYGSASTAPTGTSNTTQYTYSWPKSSTTVVNNETITETRVTNPYTITWYFHSGIIAKQETINFGATSTAPAGTANTAQYTYTWPKSSTVVSGIENIYETRSTNSYLIRWYFFSGSIAKQETLVYGSTSTAPTGTADTAQWDYEWPKSSTTVLSAEDITETRTIKSYTITWRSFTNAILKQETLNFGATSTAPIGTTSNSAYTYAWPKASTTVASAETITETRTNNSYTLSFTANGGTTPSPTSKSVIFDDVYGVLATTSLANREFIGWYKDTAHSNLVRNGDQVYKDKTNFSGTGYDPVENAFFHTSGSTTVQMNDLIDVWGNGLDSFDQYTITADFKQATPVVGYSRYYFMGICYDKNGLFIQNEHVNARANTATTLTVNLVAGAEWVYLANISNWFDDGTSTYNHQKGLAVWHPDDNPDPYTPYKYTRRWLPVKFVDKPNNRVQLNAVYSGITIPAGSAAQNHQSGGTYSYFGASNPLMTGDWTTRSGTSPATASVEGMRYGTKFFRVGWLLNRDAGVETSYIRNIKAINITRPRQQRLITSTSLMLTTVNHTVTAQWNPTVASGVMNTLATSGQTDIRYGYDISISRTDTVATVLGDAQYENQTTFVITLDRQGGTGGTSSITGLTGVSITPTSITVPTRTNYSFTGYWTATSGGTKYINADGTYNNLNSNTFVGAVTLYAQWTVIDQYFDWNPLPNTIGLTANIYINDSLQQANSLDWYQQRAANAIFKVGGLTIPAGWSYSTYSTTRLVSVSVGGSGGTTEVQGTGDITQTGARAIAITVVGNTYNVTVNQNSGTGSSASISTYQPKTSTTTITMTRGTRTDHRFSHWSVSGANGQATVNGNTITIPTYTTTVQPWGDLTITANWLTAVANGLNTLSTSLGDVQFEVATPFTITLAKQSGTGGTDSIVCVNGFYLSPTSITVPTRNGHTFNGYYTATSGGTQRINSAGNYVALTNTTYSSAVTLYAQWSLINYTLTNDRNGGSGGNNSATYDITTSSTLATLLGSPTRTGYSLSNWRWTSTSAGGWVQNTNYATSQSVVDKYATGTMQAQWTANSYTVTFNGNTGGTPSPTSKSVTFASTYGTLATVSKTNWIFIGWFTAASGGTKIESGTTVTTASNHTLFAHWTPTLVETTLEACNSTLGDIQTEYAEATYSITTSSGTGVASVSVSPASYQHNAGSAQTTTITRSASTGYTLNNATITRLGTNGGSAPTVSGTTVTIPAGSWGPFRVDQTATVNSFNITLNPNGGTGPSDTSISVTYDTSIEAWTSNMLPSRTGYTFNGYYTATVGGTQRVNNVGTYVALTSTTYTSAVTLYAQWTAISMTLTYNANGGGTPSPTSKTVTYSYTYGTLATTTWAGYAFQGWYTNAGTSISFNGGGTWALDTSLTNTARFYYATAGTGYPYGFEIIGTTFPYVSGDLSGLDYELCGYNGAGYFEINILKSRLTAVTAAAFVAWLTASTNVGIRYGVGTKVNTSTTVTATSNHTIYAQWSVNVFDITLNANGGTTASNSAISVLYNTSIEAFNINMRATRAGYLFKGYYTATSGGTQRVGLTSYTALTSSTFTTDSTLYAQWDEATNFPTVRSTASGSMSSNALSVTITLPTGHAQGDLLIIGLVLDGSRTMFAPAGWTQLANITPWSSMRHTVWYKTRGATESNPVITWSTTSEMGTWYSIAVTTGTWSGTPVATSTAGMGSTTVTANSLTPEWGSGRTLWLGLFGWDSNRTSSTTPSGYTLMTYQAGASTDSAGHRTFRRAVEAATESAGSITISGAQDSNTHMIAVCPAIVVPAPTATPTVGTPYCMNSGGTNYLYVDVTNNEASTVSVYIDGMYNKTCAASSTTSVLVYVEGSTPFIYDFVVTCLASGKSMSTGVNKAGTINSCAEF